MPSSADRSIVHILEGNWALGASNLPVWLRGGRHSPVFRFSLLSEEPPVLTEELEYETRDGGAVHELGTDRWDDGEFLSKRKGLRGLTSSRWAVEAASEDNNILVVRFSASRHTPAGINILVRSGEHVRGLRALVAHATEEFGLTPEDFATLTWFVTTGASA